MMSKVVENMSLPIDAEHGKNGFTPLVSQLSHGFESDNDDRVPLFVGTKVNLIPMPTSDPNDPLNLPTWRKTVIILSLFASTAAAAELILGGMLPVFSFEYAGLDPSHYLRNLKINEGGNGLAALDKFPGPPLWRIQLLASIPTFVMGAVNLLFVPLAISVGRRPVIIGAGVLAIAGAVWAGNSTSLDSHLGARAIQAIGAGTAESLVPFIVQDMVFYHQRNLAISSVFVGQGLIIVAIGIAAPYCIIEQSWRWVYFITAIMAALFLVGVFFLLPETRYRRSSAEMRGVPVQQLPPGQDRPAIDYDKHPPRSYRQEIALFQGKTEWMRGVLALKNVFQTFFYPHIFFVTLLNSIMIGAALGAGYTAPTTLLTEPYAWPFEHLGLCFISIAIAGAATGVFSGWGADKFANWMSRKTGSREPEIQVLNLILPTVCGLIGTIIYGIAGDNPSKYPWALLLLGLGLMVFGFLATSSIGLVYVLECYPRLAGPAIINIGSFRCLCSFVLTFRVSVWIADMGYLKTFSIYAGIMAACILFIPIIYFNGATWRRRWPGPQEIIE